MEPLILLIEPELDERAATATMTRAQRTYEQGAREISRVMREQITQGTEAAGRGFDDLETKARRAYLGMQDASEKVAAAERKAESARERGASNAETLARRVERARLDEIQAIEKATAAYREMDTAAQSAGQAGETAGTGFMGGLRGAISGAGQSGGDMANDFMGGFAGSSALLRLGASGGPIGIGLAGVAALGMAAGKVLGDNVMAGMAGMEMQDAFRARLGVDENTIRGYGAAASKAWANGFGESAQDNLVSVQFGIQAGLFDRGASDAEVQAFASQMDTLEQITQSGAQEIARGTRNLIKTGLVGSYQEAFDLIVAGQQQGLNISGDLLDTAEEYGTALHAVGLTGADSFGLIAQMQEAGIRNTDVAADSIKEFAINVSDGSESSAQAFGALGLNADQLNRKFAEGGSAARNAFNDVLNALGQLDDPIQRQQVGLALFKTKWEDAKTAIQAADLDTAADQMGTLDGRTKAASDALAAHANQWDLLGRNIDTTFGNMQKWLADTAIGKFISQGLPSTLTELTDPYNPLLLGDPRSAAEAKRADAQREAQERANRLGVGFDSAGDAQRAHRGLTPGADGLPSVDRAPAVPMPGAGDIGVASLPEPPSLPLQYSNTAGMPTGIANATTRLDEARHEVAEKEARVNQLMQSNNADADAIQKARNDLAKANQDQLQAEQSLTDARIKSTEQANKQLSGLSNDMSEMGNQLDADFGLSKGLGGLVENAVKAVGNALTAPFLAALGMIEKANPNEGSGLIGIGAANGMFGSQYTPQAIAAMQASGSAGAAGYSGGVVVPGGFGGAPSEAQVKAIAAQFGLQVTSEDRPGDSGYHGQGMALDISNGSGNTPEMRAFAEYMSQNFGSSLKELIYSDGSFAGQIGDGKNVAGSGYYSSGTLGEHENHVHIAAAWADSATQATAAVTNLAGAAQNATSLWDAVAAKESGGNWGNQDTGNNGHYGGLQFSPETWDAFGGTDLTGQSNPANATREQQIQIANNTAFSGYRGNNPQGLGAWEVITNGSVPGVNVNTPASAFGAGTAAPTGTGIYGGPGVAGVPGMPGGGMPGIGMPQSMPMGGPGGPGVGGGNAYPSTGGNSGNLMGGLAMDGLMAATSGLDMMMPGAGAAAKIGIQLANRTVGYAAQNAGILASGALETLSLGDNPKGSLGASWLGKGLGGMAGAAAALPNIAGGKPPGPMEQAGGGQAGGNTTIDQSDRSIHVKNEKATEDQTGKVIAEHQIAMNAPVGRR